MAPEQGSSQNLDRLRAAMKSRNAQIDPSQRQALAAEFVAWQQAGLQSAGYLHDPIEMTKFMDKYMAEHKIVGAKPSQIQYTSHLIMTVFHPFVRSAAMRWYNKDDNRFVLAADAEFGFRQALMTPVIAERLQSGEALGPEDVVGGVDSYLKTADEMRSIAQSLYLDKTGAGVIESFAKELKTGTSPFGDKDRIPEFMAAGATGALNTYRLIYPYTANLK